MPIAKAGSITKSFLEQDSGKFPMISNLTFKEFIKYIQDSKNLMGGTSISVVDVPAYQGNKSVYHMKVDNRLEDIIVLEPSDVVVPFVEQALDKNGSIAVSFFKGKRPLKNRVEVRTSFEIGSTKYSTYAMIPLVSGKVRVFGMFKDFKTTIHSSSRCCYYTSNSGGNVPVPTLTDIPAKTKKLTDRLKIDEYNAIVKLYPKLARHCKRYGYFNTKYNTIEFLNHAINKIIDPNYLYQLMDANRIISFG